jgi:hypothetical protein
MNCKKVELNRERERESTVKKRKREKKIRRNGCCYGSEWRLKSGDDDDVEGERS